MTRKQRRGVLIGGGVVILGVATLLVLSALRSTIVYFRTPSDVAAQVVKPGQRFRLGGLVADGTVKRGEGTTVSFTITDTDKATPVRYTGLLPDLFREGQGVIAEGQLDGAGTFVAETVLAKHDETYMPPEVAQALKDKGVFKGRPASAATKPVDAKPVEIKMGAPKSASGL
jgi:cytochrome c-type biogenesis protein CcmE